MNRTFLSLACSVAVLATTMPAWAEGGDQAQATPTIPAISAGQTVTGQIAPPATTGCAEDPRVRSYRFTAAADSRLEITMTAEAFDTVVELGRMNGCEFESLAINDDGNGPEDGLNSRLRVRLAEAGDYVIRARSLNPDGAGAFQLALNQLPPPAPEPTPIALPIGREVRGQLTANDPMMANDGDPVLESGRAYHYYALTGEAGQKFQLRLDSDEFDPVLDVGTLGPLGFAVAMSNDDGGEDAGLNSRLTVTLRSSGTIVLRVSPYSNDTGRYRIAAELVRQ